MNCIELHYMKSSVLYEHSIEALGSVDALLKCLEKGVEEKRRRKGLRLSNNEATDRNHFAARNPAPWRSQVKRHKHVRNDHVHASPEPDAQTESHPHQAIPASPLLLTKYEIRDPEPDQPLKPREAPCLQRVSDSRARSGRQISG